MAACTPSIHVFLVRPLFLLSRGIHSIINFVTDVNHHFANSALHVALRSARFISIGKYTNSSTGWTRVRQAMYEYRNTEGRSRDHYCSGKAISITYSECVSVALVIRRAKGMRRVIFSPVACPAVQYFVHIFS